jgi:endonuclease YncB( thermonuclease family)
VYDGDDLNINGQDFRLADIDTFEKRQQCQNQNSPPW